MVRKGTDRLTASLDLGFLELNVLAHDGVVLAEAHLFSLVAGILLGDIEEAGIRSRNQTDLDGSWLCHDEFLKTCARKKQSGRRVSTPPVKGGHCDRVITKSRHEARTLWPLRGLDEDSV